MLFNSLRILLLCDSHGRKTAGLISVSVKAFHLYYPLSAAITIKLSCSLHMHYVLATAFTWNLAARRLCSIAKLNIGKVIELRNSIANPFVLKVELILCGCLFRNRKDYIILSNKPLFEIHETYTTHPHPSQLMTHHKEIWGMRLGKFLSVGHL